LGGLILVAGGFFVTARGGLPGLVVLAIGVVLTIFGLIGLVIGWGLWTLHPEARAQGSCLGKSPNLEPIP
jgi:hypothetical protein